MARALRRLLRALLLFIILLTLAAAGLIAYGRHTLSARGPGAGVVMVTIPKGAPFKAVVARLDARGLLRAPWALEAHGRLNKIGPKLKAGTYSLDRALSPLEILAALERGPEEEIVRLTIPEGWNRWQIADRLAALGLVERAAFLAAVEARDLEGRLFPETYHIKRGAPLEAILGRLVRQHDKVWRALTKGRTIDAAARRRLLIIASLVEKEARVQKDRPLIARVFFNRLERGMKLQTDPTCVYGEDLYKETPHPRTCKDPNSLYSTYIIEGLPPTPIANPGRAALAATLAPASHPGAERLLYFVAKRDGSGSHAFNETYEAHKADVKRYLLKKR